MRKLDLSTHRTTPTLVVHESLSIFTMASDLTILVRVPGRGAIRFVPLRCLGGPRTGTTSGRIQVLAILVSGQ